ncbi:MAG TPA: tRNA (adenosine(37)-N6)-threonylcarbamoyltransferase complex dimerization subunit type 1 TsaB [Kofleriaceae bacterium]|nr:tRNA (adenosine(37)-N6)-threonylcarbamoyltransferase complex dimerization subunit type 1 TsaB [Kofleriaceae bacterium]
MKILGIDSSTPIASAAVLDDGNLLASGESDAAGHRADLLVLIDRVCREAGVAPLQLDAIAIGAGPGSFTGLRIGMATAKGIAFAAGKPLWGVSSLAALAYPVDKPHVVAVLDARRGELYAGVYRRAPFALDGEERLIAPADLATFSQGGVTVGDYEGLAIAARPTATAVAQLAFAGSRVDILVAGAPTYIRASEAEIRYPDGVPGALRKR